MEQVPDGIRVLIVDDQAVVANGIGKLLETSGDLTVVGIVSTGGEAIEASRTLRPSVILMDYRLPDMDGVTATVRIRTERPEVAVVILTGIEGDPQLAMAAIRAGCSGFTSKGQSVAELIGAVKAAHAGAAVIDPLMLAMLLPRLQSGYSGVGDDLTRREREVLDAMARGLSDKDIAELLTISWHTARRHVQSVIHKLGSHSKLEAVLIAGKEGIIRQYS